MKMNMFIIYLNNNPTKNITRRNFLEASPYDLMIPQLRRRAHALIVMVKVRTKPNIDKYVFWHVVDYNLKNCLNFKKKYRLYFTFLEVKKKLNIKDLSSDNTNT